MGTVLPKWLIAWVYFLLMYCIGLLVYIYIIANDLRYGLALSSKTVEIDPEVVHYNAYLKAFNKSYGRREYAKRFQIFQEALKKIDLLNEISGAVHGLTEFADVDPEELFFDSQSNGAERFTKDPYFKLKCKKGKDQRTSEIKIPKKFDLREKGVIGPVLDQKMCRGCWAISIVGAMESMAALQKIERGATLSIQELLDCSKRTLGCEGGNTLRALEEMCNKNMIIVTEEEYPLVLANEKCRQHSSNGFRIKDWTYGVHVNETKILSLIFINGPLLTVVNADPWLYYISGVIQAGCYSSQSSMKHVVQIIGYDLTADVPYYIVKNSLGPNFGMGGYVRLATGSNICGVADNIYFLTVHRANADHVDCECYKL